MMRPIAVLCIVTLLTGLLAPGLAVSAVSTCTDDEIVAMARRGMTEEQITEQCGTGERQKGQGLLTPQEQEEARRRQAEAAQREQQARQKASADELNRQAEEQRQRAQEQRRQDEERRRQQPEPSKKSDPKWLAWLGGLLLVGGAVGAMSSQSDAAEFAKKGEDANTAQNQAAYDSAKTKYKSAVSQMNASVGVAGAGAALIALYLILRPSSSSTAMDDVPPGNLVVEADVQGIRAGYALRW